MKPRHLNYAHLRRSLRYFFLFLMALGLTLFPQMSFAGQSHNDQGFSLRDPAVLPSLSFTGQLQDDRDLALSDPAVLRPSSLDNNGQRTNDNGQMTKSWAIPPAPLQKEGSETIQKEGSETIQSPPFEGGFRGITHFRQQSPNLWMSSDKGLRTNDNGQLTLDQAIQVYQAEQFAEAVRLFQTISQTAESASDRISASTYLSLTHQKLGQWTEATNAVDTSLALIQSTPALKNADLLLAQALNARAHLFLATGQTETALNIWKQAAIVYRRAGDPTGLIGSLVNQAQALQTLGLYQEALNTLEQLTGQLQAQPDSALKVAGLRSLGNTLRVIGDLKEAERVLAESLTIARRLDDRENIVRSLLSLGSILQSQSDAVLNLEYVLPDRREAARQVSANALSLYQQAEALTLLPPLRAQAQLSQFSLLVKTRQTSSALALLPKVQAQLATLPPSRTSVYAQIQLAEGLTQLKTAPRRESVDPTPPWLTIAKIAATATKQSESLQDVRARSYALGNLGNVYERTQQWSTAQDLTKQALLLSQSIKADDITYRWQWQSGRLYKALGDRPSALAAYAQAVETLKLLRRDLVAINPEVQFSFRDSVEPIYRDYVSLLLDDAASVAIAKTKADRNLEQSRLVDARNAIESLQLAELENFLRQACLEASPVQIDQVDPTAAVFYPIILPDRLEVILSLPNQLLRHYAVNIPQPQLEATLFDLRSGLTDRSADLYFAPAQQVYDWLIRPILADLTQEKIETLVFVLDGSLRNIPMSALYDGNQYLAQQFRVAITPGLKLIDVKPLKREGLKALLAGLTESRQGFSALPNVGKEIEQIEQQVSSQVLLNDNFVTSTLKQEIAGFDGPIVHLATHGEFSSNADDTFVLTWDGRLNINQLTSILQKQSTNPQQAIELLILSACRTALGDRRAALGLSGMAVRAGARSTIGSLWYVDDAAATALMVNFYKNLTDSAIPKAEALRRAQLTLISSEEYSHPYFWAPFILVGNWL